MVATHLVDTSVLTRIGRPAVRAALAPLAEAAAIARCALTDLELGFSASNDVEWDGLQASLSKFAAVQVDAATITRAKSLQRALASRGFKGRKVPDLLIAAAAELNGLTLVHYDGDFELIATVSGQRHQWVVPRGSID